MFQKGKKTYSETICDARWSSTEEINNQEGLYNYISDNVSIPTFATNLCSFPFATKRVNKRQQTDGAQDVNDVLSFTGWRNRNLSHPTPRMHKITYIQAGREYITHVVWNGIAQRWCKAEACIVGGIDFCIACGLWLCADINHRLPMARSINGCSTNCENLTRNKTSAFNLNQDNAT